MKRREFITLLGSMAVAWPFAALAQRKSNSYRIGYLALLTGERTTLVKVFLQRLHELGYSEDKNMVFEYRSAEGQADRVPALAAELVRADPDVPHFRIAPNCGIPSSQLSDVFPGRRLRLPPLLPTACTEFQ